MFNRFLATLALLVSLGLLPLTANAVLFPAGIDWTNASQQRFVQSLYLNMFGRAPNQSESATAVRGLQRNDNRTARLRIFESLLQSAEYRRAFNNTDNSWQVFQAPDYNYDNGAGFFRYRAAQSQPAGFTQLSGTGRLFSMSIAQSVAHYYNAFCYRGDPCINNPELARDRGANTLAQTTTVNAHACADNANLNSQFKWVAVNGTTYPRGIGEDTICMEDAYYTANQLRLNRFDCDPGYINCERNSALDLRASRAGSDNTGNPALFFRDGSRLVLIQTQDSIDNSGVTIQPETNTDPLLADAHACADPSKTTSRFTWRGTNQTAESKGIGSNLICMDNFYYEVQGTTLIRYSCNNGFTNCQPDTANNLKARSRTTINGKPAFVFSNGSTVTLSERGLPASGNSTQQTPSTRTTINSNNQLQNYRGTDCADSKKRLSQFRWRSNGLSSWPDGVDGKFICLNNQFYEISQTRLRNYSCQSNYTNCRANPREDIAVTEVGEDGAVWILGNGDQITLISQ